MKTAVHIVLLLLFSACAKKEVEQPDAVSGLDYYPLKAGRFAVFEADSIVYTEIPRDTVHYRYLVKEVLAEAFTDAAGEEAWRLERYIKKHDPKRPYDSIPWSVKDVWQVNADNKSVQVVEENARYTKLSFPVKENGAWNGNAHNTEGEVIYRYQYVDRPEQIGALLFENTLRVSHKDVRTLISYEAGAEKYARGAGLVYKEFFELFSNNIVPGKPVESRIEKGVAFTQTLIAHGYQ